MKTTLISLSAMLVLIFAISFSSPASVKNVTTDNIVCVGDSTHVCPTDGSVCNHKSHKVDCKTMTKKECKTKCASSSPKCSKAEKKACCSKAKKK